MQPLGQIYVATSNAGKLRDFRTAATMFAVSIAPLPGLDELAPPPEDGATFEENARLKAIAYSAARPGLMVVADDSGLEVDALDGQPGVRSARFAEDGGFVEANAGATLNTDQKNNLHLLARLRMSGSPALTARYRCVLAAARDGVCLLTANGAVEGVILSAPRGAGGFGYDPLFYLPQLGQTMAEIDEQTRQRLSHRGQALRALLAAMRERGW
jgi:XTP/dITP diphosphohydrolase